MVEKSHVYLEMAKIELSEARQYESQREKIVGFCTVFSGASVALLANNDNNSDYDLLFALISLVVNFASVIFLLKIYIQFKVRYERYRSLRSEIDSAAHTKVVELIRGADLAVSARKRYKFAEPIKIHYIWLTIPSLLFVGNLVVLISLLL